MAGVNLTTLANVKGFLDLQSSNQDALITRLIATESRQIESYCGCKFPYVANVNKALTGTGTSILPLPDGPILSVSSLTIGVTPILPSTDGVTQYGYTFDDVALYLVGDVFPRCPPKYVIASWTAGWQSSETDTLVSPGGNATTITLAPTTDGTAGVDLGVVYTATGAPFTAVPAANTPSQGQYSFNAGVYTFAAADATHAVTMNYAYIPPAVEQACIEMVALDMKQKQQIGVKSRSIDHESVSFETSGMTPSVMQMLYPFRRMTVG